MNPTEIAILCGTILFLLLALCRAGPVACRLCLLVGITSLIATFFSLGVLVIRSEPGCLILFAVVAFFWMMRGGYRGTGWLFGTSRWADVSRDLLPAGMLSGDGYLLGQAEAPMLSAAFRGLFKAPWKDSLAACQMFFAAMNRKRVWVSCDRATHGVIFAGAGKGKTTSIIQTFLLTTLDAVICIDIKGENSKLVADRRRAFGHRMVNLDPWLQATTAPDKLNPLDLLDPDSPHLIDDAQALAEALVVRTGDEKEPHWNDAAVMWIAAMIALVSTFRDRAGRDLQTVVAAVANTESRQRALATLRARGGLFARMADQLAAFEGRELGSVLTTVARHLRFLSTPAVADSTTASTFDPRELLAGKMSIFLIIPPDRLQAQCGLLRLWITTLLTVIIRSGLKRGTRIRMVLDEAAALGRLEAVENAVAQLRGYGLSCLFCYQSAGQLEKVFPNGQSQTFLSNMDLRVYFGVNDHATAQSVSDQCGDCTLMNRSASGGTSTTRNRDAHGMETSSSSSNSNWNEQETGRKLLQPAEVMQLSERTAVVFAPGVPPCTVELVRHYEPEFKKRLKPPSMWLLAGRSLFFGLGCLALAGTVCAALIASKAPARSQPVPPPVAPPATPAPTGPFIRPRPDLGKGVFTVG